MQPAWEGPSGQPVASQGAESNYTLCAADPGREPPDHALGRSRGGVSTKIHQLVDGRGRPLVIALTAGQAGDSPMLKVLLADLAVARPGGGRPRTRPDTLLGDKAYSSAANRELLRRKRVKTVIPQPADQIAHRQRRGSEGGRPPDFNATTYKGRNVIERSFNDHKQWRGLATRYDKLATTYRGGVVLRAIAIWLRQ
jgi:putative transposase